MPRKAKLQTHIEGFGCIFQPRYRDRKGKLRTSSIWWMEYKTAEGNKLRRSTGQTQQTEAFAELMKVGGKKSSGEIIHTAPERIRIDQLLDMLIKSYENKNTLYDLTLRVNKYLRPHFGSRKAVELRKSELETFIDQVQKGKKGPDGKWIERPLSDASVNRCLANLHRAFQIGAEEDPPLVLRVPKFPYRKEDNARLGILEPADYRKLRDALIPHARLVLVIGYHTGMRRGEITKLRWDQVDFEAGVIRLEKKQTKMKRERIVPMYGDMRGCLEMAKADRDLNHPRCPHVIAENGMRVADIKTAWNAAVRRCAIPRVLVHDLRRTAASNMDQAGIPRRIIMDICGWKTEAMFFRYRIGTEKQAIQAGQTMETWMAMKLAEAEVKKPKDRGSVQ